LSQIGGNTRLAGIEIIVTFEVPIDTVLSASGDYTLFLLI